MVGRSVERRFYLFEKLNVKKVEVKKDRDVEVSVLDGVREGDVVEVIRGGVGVWEFWFVFYRGRFCLETKCLWIFLIRGAGMGGCCWYFLGRG